MKGVVSGVNYYVLIDGIGTKLYMDDFIDVFNAGSRNTTVVLLIKDSIKYGPSD